MDQTIYVWGGIALLVGLVVYGSFYFDKRRRESLSGILSRLGFEFDPGPHHPSRFPFAHLSLFDRGRKEAAKNIGRLKAGNKEFIFCDYQYTSGSGKNKSTNHFSIFCLAGQFDLPGFTLGKEDMMSKIAQGLGYDDIDISSDEEFSRKFVLRGGDKERVQTLFTPEVMQIMKQHPKIDLEAGRGAVMLYRWSRIKPNDVVSWIEEGKQIFGLFAH